MSWRDKAAPIIAEVISQIGRQDLTVLRKALADAYPWGERERYPYKAWLAEIHCQLGHTLNKPKADPANTQLDIFNQV